MIYLFCECEENDIANYPEDTSPCYCGTDIPNVISGNNHIKANLCKCHLLLYSWSPKVVSIDETQI